MSCISSFLPCSAAGEREDELIKTYASQLPIIPISGTSYGHLICVWRQIKDPIQPNNRKNMIRHVYAACINTETYNNVFIDCPPERILLKSMVSLIGRPFLLLKKTLYHLSFIPILKALIDFGKSSSLDAGPTIKTCFKSMADIIRTPFYQIALIVCTIGVICLGIIQPKTLYSSRQFLGELEQLANWGEKNTEWTLASCFQSITFNDVFKGNSKIRGDTLYSSHPLQNALTNFARMHIRFLSFNPSPLDFSCEVPYDFRLGRAYTSAGFNRTDISKKLMKPLSP